VAKILGVVNDVTPDPPGKTEPPFETEYQSIVKPAPPVAERTTVPVPHREPPVTVGAEGMALTVATTAALVEETQFVVVFFAST
jgi:hypothetical protein